MAGEKERQGKENEKYAEKGGSVVYKEEQLKIENVRRKRTGRYGKRMIER